jgi:GT2 family glycosyltransferase
MIGRAVRSVLDQEYPELELLVVDQSTGDATEQVARSVASGDPRLRYVRLAQRGLSRAYNRGAREARYELLAFTDDDCLAPSDWLRSVAGAFTEHPEAGLVYGQVLGPLESDGWPADAWTVPTLGIERLERLSRRDGFRVFGMGADFAARRSMVLRLGGFDEVLGGGGPLKSAQDFDFAWRVFRDGGVILLDPRVMVRHYGFRAASEWPATMRSYGVGVGGFFMKHVRTGDGYAVLLLAQMWLRHSIRMFKRLLVGQSSAFDRTYLRHLAVGMRSSLAYPVDRRRRLYRFPER